MIMWSGWPVVRSILEALYFVAGIVIAVAAVIGLKQLSLGLEQLRATKDIAKNNALRSALEFATERCQYYADKIVPAHEAFRQLCLAAGCTFLPLSNKWAVKNGEILPDPAFKQANFQSQFDALRVAIPAFLNSLEAFAIPFVARVADDDLGYQETGISFCSVVKETMAFLFYMRQMSFSGPYQSTLRLYERWDGRRNAEEIGRALKKAERAAKQVPKPGKIDALGTEN
jgi:hypothetical protein